MARTNVRGASQKEFVRLFDSVCNWNQRWERWQDMVNLFAISIANVTDKVHEAERTEHYERIRAKYKPEEFSKFQDLFNELVESLEANPFQDFLGQMYMELELGSHWHGQFFTPYNVCGAMARMSITDATFNKIAENGWISANDPACGGGATLIAFAEALKERDVNYQRTVLFVGQDLDTVAAMMCYIQLSLLGCAGYVHNGNTLTAPLTGDILMPDESGDTWYTPMYFSDVWAGRVMARRMDRTMQAMLRPSELPAKKENIVEIPKKGREKANGRTKRDGIGEQLSFFAGLSK